MKKFTLMSIYTLGLLTSYCTIDASSIESPIKYELTISNQTATQGVPQSYNLITTNPSTSNFTLSSAIPADMNSKRTVLINMYQRNKSVTLQPFSISFEYPYGTFSGSNCNVGFYKKINAYPNPASYAYDVSTAGNINCHASVQYLADSHIIKMQIIINNNG